LDPTQTLEFYTPKNKHNHLEKEQEEKQQGWLAVRFTLQKKQG
jgi:hypothetical protein